MFFSPPQYYCDNTDKLLCAFGEGDKRFVGDKESPELQTAGKDAFSHFRPRMLPEGNVGHPLSLPGGFGEPGVGRKRWSG